jgi:hypothetical protein
MQDPPAQPPFGQNAPQTRGGSRTWLWLLVGAGVLFCLPCGGVFAWVFYIGAVGPETSVYTGNQVPARFVSTMKDVGALDDDESILYFYSDAMTDIRNGFYFVSDKRVVVYSNQTGGTPLTAVPFDEITEVDIVRDESFFEDSVITLELECGLPVSFPVSSDAGGDQRFFDAIQSRVDESTP